MDHNLLERFLSCLLLGVASQKQTSNTKDYFQCKPQLQHHRPHISEEKGAGDLIPIARWGNDTILFGFDTFVVDKQSRENHCQTSSIHL